MARVYNFSAGPAVLPQVVLQRAAQEMLDYQGCGLSVMEMSHRGKTFEGIIANAEKDLRELMAIPVNYKVLFLQGGASLQFTMVPLNLMVKSKKADYVHTGAWSKKAITEAKKIGQVNIVASSEPDKFTCIPDLSKAKFSPDADYVYIVTNNTIEGTVYQTVPNTGNVPLVADMSSNILCESVDVAKFGLIFAGAQKNIGPAGLTVVIVREDLIGKAAGLAAMLDYKVHADDGSMFNTPPCYAIYIAGLVFEWLKAKGGLTAMAEYNRKKAKVLYDYIDQSKLFKSPVKKENRSLMNVPFIIGDEKKEEAFLAEASKKGLKTLKGHRSVGGMRASIYNAMPIEGVQALVNFMAEFEAKNK